MTEKLKEVREAVEVLEKCIIPLEPENKSIKTILSLARTVLEAGEKIEFHAAPNNYTTIEKQYAECEHQAQDWLASDCIHCKFAVLIARARHLEETIQAVLPVVAKKDLIIADLKHNNQCLTGSIEQAHSYWKSAEKKVAEQAKRIEWFESQQNAKTVAERGG